MSLVYIWQDVEKKVLVMKKIRISYNPYTNRIHFQQGFVKGVSEKTEAFFGT